ncbi:MAG: DctP family TRAP transporter solute-binding subunit [Desulfovibrio sp.]|nr:DctP family TRAP transporter solute-binding subunit [Desulfovibrio sp.]
MAYILMIVTLFIANASFVTAAPINLRLGHIAEMDNPYAQGAEYFANLVRQRSQGEIIIHVYPAGKLGAQGDLIAGVTAGTMDMALTSSAVLANYIPKLALFDLPFLFRDRQHAYRALDAVGMELSATGYGQDIITLAFWENGVRHMTNNVRPIVRPQDMQGVRFRVMEQPICIEVMKALGAKPIPMPITELYDALQQGLVDGQENPLAHIATKRYYEVQKFLSLTSHTYAAEPLLISGHVWKKLTPNQRELLRTTAEEVRDWQRKLCSEQETKFFTIIRESGTCQINDNVDMNAFRKATKKVWTLYTKIFGDKDLKAVLALQ